MKINRKVMLAAISSVAVISAAAVGTMMYFTDHDSVVNAFTVGQVEIELDEEDTDDSRTDVTTKGRDKANTYHLVPGATLPKDPIIHISDDSADCWLFVKIENGIENIIDMTALEQQLSTNGWSPLNVNGQLVKDIYTRDKYEKGDGKDIAVFESFTVNGENVVNPEPGETAGVGKYDIRDYGDKQIKVTAYAIQADGFETAGEAWMAEFAD